MIRWTSRGAVLGACLAAVVCASTRAEASACCLSAAVVGTGRLVVWEDAAAGLTTSLSHGLGHVDAQGRWYAAPTGTRSDDVRTSLWAIVRLHEKLQLSARAPWMVGVRASGSETSWGTGLGDVQAGVRFDLLGVGDYAHVPGVALVATVVGPTGRRPEAATDALGASATGRGVWAGGLGVAVEYAALPYFLRLDAGLAVSAPFRRLDTGAQQQFGPGLQVALSGGREVLPDVLVLGATLNWNAEAPLTSAGQPVAGSEVRSLTASVLASWKLSPRWQIIGGVSTDALGRLGVAQNGDDRLAVTLGVRHGVF